MDTIFTTAPRYECHKNVGALEIKEVGNYQPSESGLFRLVEFVGGNHAMLADELFRRYVPVPGDFLVIYEDGYMSFSPRKAFLDGYSPMGKTFSEIKADIKAGK